MYDTTYKLKQYSHMLKTVHLLLYMDLQLPLFAAMFDDVH